MFIWKLFKKQFFFLRFQRLGDYHCLMDLFPTITNMGQWQNNKKVVIAVMIQFLVAMVQHPKGRFPLMRDRIHLVEYLVNPC